MELLGQMDRADLRLLIYVGKLLQVGYECPFSHTEYYNNFFCQYDCQIFSTHHFNLYFGNYSLSLNVLLLVDLVTSQVTDEVTDAVCFLLHFHF